MPQYILCPICTRIPVTRPDEPCAECQRKQDEADRRKKAKNDAADRRAEERLERLERKPRRVGDVMK
jgi:hypothetical protein